jgi:RNase adapter protein RapZ
MQGTMRLLIVSGLSGSGKSVALHMLEDLGYYCIDNIPAALLKAFISHTVQSSNQMYGRTAVGIDARNTAAEIRLVPALVEELRRSGIDCELIFLTASDDELLRRYAETRRSHPLSRGGTSLREAIDNERQMLEPVVHAADLVVDTSRMGIHDLRYQITQRVDQRQAQRLAVLIESFGFKHGIPGDADFVFDARSLPNPYWDTQLRDLNGLDTPVSEYLAAQPAVQSFIDDVLRFLTPRLPEFLANNRSYLTIAIGCTGGQHRSVYIAEQLAAKLGQDRGSIQVRHSSLQRERG